MDRTFKQTSTTIQQKSQQQRRSIYCNQRSGCHGSTQLLTKIGNRKGTFIKGNHKKPTEKKQALTYPGSRCASLPNGTNYILRDWYLCDSATKFDLCDLKNSWPNLRGPKFGLIFDPSPENPKILKQCMKTYDSQRLRSRKSSETRNG